MAQLSVLGPLWVRLHNFCHKRLGLEPESLEQAVDKVILARLQEMADEIGTGFVARFLGIEGPQDTGRDARERNREVRLER